VESFRNDVSPIWKGRGFPLSSFPPSIRVYISSRGRQNSPIRGGDFSSITSSPLKEGDDGCSSISPIKPSVELSRSVVSTTKNYLDKELFKHGIIQPFNPLIFVNWLKNYG